MVGVTLSEDFSGFRRHCSIHSAIIVYPLVLFTRCFNATYQRLHSKLSMVLHFHTQFRINVGAVDAAALGPVVKVRGARGAQPPASTLAEFGPPARI